MALLGAKTFQNYIAGEWVDAASGETFESTSPADGETLGIFPRSGRADVERAVEAAKQAFEDWRLVPAPKRGEILFRFGQLLADGKEDLAELMTHEMGKVLPEARGDVQEAVDMAFYMGGEGRRLFGQTTPSELRDKFNMSVRMPIGVVGVITPWNFPIAIPSWKILPALVCGNTVVFKPATDTPALGERFVELLAEAGVPPGVVNVVHGGGGEVGNAIVTHPDVPVITLTGSRDTGVAVTKAAAERLKHVHLELGGKNAIIVLDDADLDLAVEGILWSAFGTSGQRCTAASRVIAHEAVYDQLVSRLVASTNAAQRPLPEPPEDRPERRIEPDDEVGLAQHEIAELAAVVSVDDPAGVRQRGPHAGPELIRRGLCPVRPPMESVELDVRHVVVLGELFGKHRLARAGRPDDGDLPGRHSPTRRCRSGPSAACPSSRRKSISTR